MGIHFFYFFINIQILGTIDYIDNNIKINLSNGLINIYCLCDNPHKLSKYLKKNMYYHIKHNKINDEVMAYYTKNQNNLKQINQNEENEINEENEKNEERIINDE